MKGSRFEKFPFGKAELDNRRGELEKMLVRMKKHLAHQSWPKTCNMDHICKTTEERNQTAYYPNASSSQNAAIPSIWKSFVDNLCVDHEKVSSKKRMEVFRSIAAKKSTTKTLPHIYPAIFQTNNCAGRSSLAEATGKELLLGEEGQWKSY